MSHCYFPIAFLTQAPVPFLYVADFKDVRRGWDLRDTQTKLHFARHTQQEPERQFLQERIRQLK